MVASIGGDAADGPHPLPQLWCPPECSTASQPVPANDVASCWWLWLAANPRKGCWLPVTSPTN